MKIAVASEHRGYKAKDKILSLVRELHHEGLDFGPSTDEMLRKRGEPLRVAKSIEQSSSVVQESE